MLDKIIADKGISVELALPWVMQAKNSLANVHGFSPCQLTFGQNPQLPNILNDELPALEEKDVGDVLRRQLEAMRSARQAFIKAECDEKIKRALRHNIRPSSKNIFVQGDLVFYKRNDCRQWRGPGKVIGCESATVLIKHGAQYVRVHMCRVLPVKGTYYDTKGDARHITRDLIHEDSQSLSTPSETANNESEDEVEPQRRENSEETESHRVENREELTMDQPSDKNAENGFYENADDRHDGDSLLANYEQSNVKLLRGQQVEFETKDGVHVYGEMMRRTGKATGKYRDYWETKDRATGNIKEYDTKKDFIWLKENDKNTEKDANVCTHEIYFFEKAFSKNREKIVKEAKEAELEKWSEEDVYEVVQDIGQDRLSVTWVITDKMVNDEHVTKARLVVRGYEENEKIRSDSPTCGKENIRILLALAVSKKLESTFVGREGCIPTRERYRKRGLYQNT